MKTQIRKILLSLAFANLASAGILEITPPTPLAPELAFLKQGNALTVSFTTQLATGYTLQYSLDLITWGDLDTKWSDWDAAKPMVFQTIYPGPKMYLRIKANAWTWDTDGDGLTDFQEYGMGLNMDAYDTDGDGIPDGWDSRYGRALIVDDPDSDDDGDYIALIAELAAGTNPNSADTDGDGRGDLFELNNGTDPNDATDFYPTRPLVALTFYFGDGSGSGSEILEGVLTSIAGRPRTFIARNRSHGVFSTMTVMVQAGTQWIFELRHVASLYSTPDYDYDLEFSAGWSSSRTTVKLDDPEGIFGTHHTGSYHFAEGKQAIITVPYLKVTTEVIINGNADRAQIGIGEHVTLDIEPPLSALGDVFWSITQPNPSEATLTQGIGPFTVLQAADEAEQTWVRAAFRGEPMTAVFNTITPTEIRYTKNPNTYGRHKWGKPSAGMWNEGWIMPATVSFTRLSVIEGNCDAVAPPGYWAEFAGLPHVPSPLWSAIVRAPLPPSIIGGSSTGNRMVLGDEIWSGWIDSNNWSVGGQYSLLIPCWFRVGANGTPANWLNVLHLVQTTTDGTTTISKGGASRTFGVWEPDVNY